MPISDHAHSKTIEITLSFPEFAPQRKISVHSIKSFLRYSQFLGPVSCDPFSTMFTPKFFEQKKNGQTLCLGRLKGGKALSGYSRGSKKRIKEIPKVFKFDKFSEAYCNYFLLIVPQYFSLGFWLTLV